MSVEVTVPSVGESISEVYIGAWLKQEGDAVAKDEALVEIETDKATVEVSAPVAGVLGKVVKRAGDTATVGEVIAHLEAGDGAAAVPSSEAKTAEVVAEAATAAPPEDDADQGRSGGDGAAAAPASAADASADARAMPAAQRLLDEHGLRAGDVRGSGPGGRILKEDVQRHVAAAASRAVAAATPRAVAAAGQPKATSERSAPAPAPTSSGPRQEESVPMSPLRRKIAERLVQAQQTAALLTTFNEIDMSAVMALRAEYKDPFEKRYGVRLGFMSFFVKAAIDALKLIPQLNAEIRDGHIVYKNYFDIGVAVSTPKGLVVPVVRNAELLSFAEVEQVIGDFGGRARDNRLVPEELQGGTFTITNGGIFGSLLSTPIVNPPQSGVLGMHAIQERPVAIDGRVEIRPMMYVALTYDHRIVDGREAVTFLKRVKETIEKPARMLIEV
jgi:2-oxoglutarate dehydrogenase E2 component (dihydrolipoamide succinyltransferase)